MIPCYITGKGMHATDATWNFKTAVIKSLEETGLGYDTRYRYYQQQLPELEAEKLARLICDPMENYDKGWPEYLDHKPAEMSEQEAATRFMLVRDKQFIDQAQCAIACYDEAGFGSGINAMRFLNADKPVLGFYNLEKLSSGVNPSNLLQLELDFPKLFTLYAYQDINDITSKAINWLNLKF